MNSQDMVHYSNAYELDMSCKNQICRNVGWWHEVLDAHHPRLKCILPIYDILIASVMMRGLENPATACHLSCPILLLAYTMTSLAEAIISAAPLRPESPLLQSLAALLQELLVDDKKEDPVDPSDFYQSVGKVLRIRVHALGDAISSLMKLLDFLRGCDPVIGECIEKALYSGRCSNMMLGKRYDPNSQVLCIRKKWGKEKALDVPFRVACASIDEQISDASLYHALKQSLSPRPLRGYKWSGDFEETTESVAVDAEKDIDDENEWNTSRRLAIRRLPPYWLLHVDHFSSTNAYTRPQSKRRSCSIPLTLNADFVYGYEQNEDLPTYHLTGGILHLSNDDVEDDEEDGHYVSIVKSQIGDTWTLIDDSKLIEVSEDTCLSLLAGCQSSLSENGTYMQACLVVYRLCSATEDIELA